MRSAALLVLVVMLHAAQLLTPSVSCPPPRAAVDFGIPQLQEHMQQFRFPWLLSNVLDARTGEPLGGCERSRIVTWQGVRVGLMGLVEREVSWMLLHVLVSSS